jgi:hypothetical protein
VGAGCTRARPGLDQALAAVRAGDTLVVPKLDRLARSVPDARAIGDSLAARGVKLSLGGEVYDPSDPMGKMFLSSAPGRKALGTANSNRVSSTNYNNLILLCPNHHTRVDKQERHYAESKLREIKTAHETWTSERRQSDRPIRVRDVTPGAPVVLQRITTASALMAVIGQSLAFQYSKPDDLSDDEFDLVGAFLQEMTDWMDLWSELGPAQQLSGERDTGRSLDQLRDAGFVVDAGIRAQVLEGGVGPPSRWKTAVLVIRRSDDDDPSADITDKQGTRDQSVSLPPRSR